MIELAFYPVQPISVPRSPLVSNAKLHTETAIAQQANLREQWTSQVASEPLAAVDLHPNLLWPSNAGNVVDPAPSEKRRLVCRLNADANALGVVAALEPKQVRLPVVPGLNWRPKLQGLRLVGNQLLGKPTTVQVEEMVAAMVDPINGTSDGEVDARYDCLVLEALDVRDPLWNAVQDREVTDGATCLQLETPQTHWRLEFPEHPDEYWKKFSSKTRYNFRRTSRRLPHDWECVETDSQVEQFLSDAAQVSENSWQGRRIGTRVRRDQGAIDYYQGLAELGALRSYVLRQDDKPVAFAIGTQWAGRFMLEEIGYDQQFADLSPGTVLMLRMLEDMFERKTPQRLDFGFGDGKYKQLFGTDSSKSGNLLLIGCRWKPTLIGGLRHVGQSLGSAARTILRTTGLETRLRQLYRRQA